MFIWEIYLRFPFISNGRVWTDQLPVNPNFAVPSGHVFERLDIGAPLCHTLSFIVFDQVTQGSSKSAQTERENRSSIGNLISRYKANVA